MQENENEKKTCIYTIYTHTYKEKKAFLTILFFV